MRTRKVWLSVVMVLMLLMSVVGSASAAGKGAATAPNAPNGYMTEKGTKPPTPQKPGEVSPDDMVTGDCGTSWALLSQETTPGQLSVAAGATCSIGIWTSVSYTWTLYKFNGFMWSSYTTGYGGDPDVWGADYSDSWIISVPDAPAEYKITVKFNAGVLKDSGLSSSCTGTVSDQATVSW